MKLWNFLNAQTSKEVVEAKPSTDVTLDISRLNVSVPIKLAIHSGEGRPGMDHLDSWVPLFHQSSIPFCVITRLESLFEYCKQTYPDVFVVYAKKEKDIDITVSNLASLKTIFYPSNTGNNIHLARFNNYKHVFVGHGDSDKTSSAHKLFRLYDEIWVAGQAHTDRFANAGFDLGHLKFIKVGRPILTKLLPFIDERPWAERFATPSLCYLPTWEGVWPDQTYSSLPLACKLLQESSSTLQNGVFHVKLHPRSGTVSSDYKTMEKNILALRKNIKNTITIHEKREPLNDVLPLGNVFICDVSSVITDCLLVDAPIFVYLNPHVKQRSSAMPLEKFAYTFENVSEFKLKLGKLTQTGDYLASGRAKAREYYLGLTEIVNGTFFKLLKKEAK
jgi:hypothetical protein